MTEDQMKKNFIRAADGNGYFSRAAIEESVRQSVCADCGGPATQFKDRLSRKEFTRSGLCQKCQDGVFGRAVYLQSLR